MGFEELLTESSYEKEGIAGPIVASLKKIGQQKRTGNDLTRMGPKSTQSLGALMSIFNRFSQEDSPPDEVSGASKNSDDLPQKTRKGGSTSKKTWQSYGTFAKSTSNEATLSQPLLLREYDVGMDKREW